MTRSVALAPALALLLALACHPQAATRPPTPTFAGERALELAAWLSGLPRALGDPRRGASVDLLIGELRRRGAEEIRTLDHRAADPWSGEVFEMTTLIADLRPSAPRRFILATHFDTRPWAEADPDPARREAPIPGANDGTSGVAVLLELLPLVAEALPDEVGLSLILFDGEELGRPPAVGYCAGSRALAAEIRAGRFDDLRGAELAIVIDMIGDAELRILPEQNSLTAAPWLIDQIWATAERAGYPEFAAGPSRSITDDHVALIELGIPAVLLIDAEYPHWHTHADTLDKLGARSLEAVGETLRRTLVTLARGRPASR
ncbi:MAG: M28 family peptidase [Myxococcales bacterium]|nr:M28 family peptidase [Myxococcales bacterium]